MKKAFLAAILLAATSAFAQTLLIGTGSNTGTYSKMLKEINQTCASAIPITEQNTSGSLENMALLTGNKINGAFTQTDVLYFLGRTDDRLQNVKTLVALHPEEVHVVALAQSKTVVGGNMLGMGKQPLQVKTIEDLVGRTVGAWGGSYITAQVIRLQSQIKFDVQEFPGAKEAKAALDAGQIEAIIAVGGAPLGFVETLNKSYKLVPIPNAEVLKAVYRPAKITYTNLDAMGVATVATDALFVTREYKTEKFSSALGRLRACILANLDELKEGTGMHPKWQAVDAGNKGKWAYYELPTPTVPVAAKKK